jgi:hypothetical protein
MIIAPLVNLASGYIQSLFSNPVSGSSSSGTSASGTPGAGSTSASGTNQLSPFAQVLSNLQQLEQSSSIQYTTVTQQIASGLQTAAQSATASGFTGLGGELSQLSTDFNNASTTNQLPNVQHLAQSIGGGSSSSSTSSGAGNNATSNLSQFLQSLNASQSGNSSLSALSIIDNTLSTAGL